PSAVIDDTVNTRRIRTRLIGIQSLRYATGSAACVPSLVQLIVRCRGSALLSAPWHTTHVDEPLRRSIGDDVLKGLSQSERALAIHSEALWRRAHQLARDNHNVDPGDIYHALRCLELEPAERLRRGLSRGRLRAHA